MSERKVISKYYPVDFDPSKLARKPSFKNQDIVVRMMTPFGIQCNTCASFIGRNTKFNMKLEYIQGADYLGAVRRYRFFFRCKVCKADIVFATDPENCDYVMERGGHRLAELWSKRHVLAEKEKQEELDEQERDALLKFQKRTEAHKRELEFMDEIEMLRDRSRKARSLTMDQLVASLRSDEQADKTAAPKTEEELRLQDAEQARMKLRAIRQKRLRPDAGFQESDNKDAQNNENEKIGKVPLPKRRRRFFAKETTTAEQKQEHVPVAQTKQEAEKPAIKQPVPAETSNEAPRTKNPVAPRRRLRLPSVVGALGASKQQQQRQQQQREDKQPGGLLSGYGSSSSDDSSSSDSESD
ncbi:MAG: hypothetical protein MHM6MM_000885 [Cercozoa sp. M6MM]